MYFEQCENSVIEHGKMITSSNTCTFRLREEIELHYPSLKKKKEKKKGKLASI